jgi:hypothetical protein
MSHGQETTFTYQGRLTENGAAFTGNAEFQPTLWNVASGGGAPVAVHSPAAVIVGVTNGLFVLPLDFGTNFPGAARWLQLEVRTTIGPFFTLTPRQQLTATPYAITAGNLSGSLPAVQLSGALPSAGLSGVYSEAVTFNNVGNSFSGNGTGLTNLDAGELGSGTVPDGRLASNIARTNQVWLLTGNSGTTPGTHFLGTTDNQPLEFKISGRRVVRFEDNGDSIDGGTTGDGAPNIIAGSPGNYVAANVVGATIAGGGATNYFGFGSTNCLLSDYSTIGGGYNNQVSSNAIGSTIGGGALNQVGRDSTYSFIAGYGNIIRESTFATISGGVENSIGFFDPSGSLVLDFNSDGSVISGGWGNNISSNSPYSAIGGGGVNFVGPFSGYATIGGGSRHRIGSNSFAGAIGGGWGNQISNLSSYATIPGGLSNSAVSFGFAAGRNAKANHTGTFVWADARNNNFISTSTNQFLIRAAAGVGINTNNPQSALHVHGTVTATAFNPPSDRNLKENFKAVDSKEVLEKIVQMPLAEWSFKEDAVRHIGPMAQDFHAAFGLGTDERHIATVDADGVALAAIQGLNQKVEEQGMELKRKDAAIIELTKRLESLEMKIGKE